MKKKIMGISIMLLLTVTALPFSSSAESEWDVVSDVELDVSIFGAGLLTGIRQVGFSMYNSGGNAVDETIKDIRWTFTVKSIDDENIDLSYAAEIESMAYNQGCTFFTNEATGSGPVELTLTATSSNAGEVNKTIKGFQIGPITISQNFLLSELLQ